MKKIYLTFFLFALFGLSTALATTHTINIDGLSFSPDDLNANLGDTINIVTSPNHPTAQVSKETWDANGTTPLGSGWGVLTSSFSFVISSTDTIYYVCQNHVGGGMKGKINVSTITSINEASTNAFSVFPNPSYGDFTIAGDEEMLTESKLILYNINGQMAHSYIITSGNMKLKQEVTPGVYIGIIEKNGEILLRERLVLLGQ